MDDKITSDFLLFNGISKLIENINDLDEGEVTYLKNLVDSYIKTHNSEAGECLLQKIDIFKDIKKLNS